MIQIETIIASVITAAVTALAMFITQERRLKKDFEMQDNKFKNQFEMMEKKIKTDFELDRDKVRTEFMAEQVAEKLLNIREPKRSFSAIKKRLGGFEDDDLRQILVRSGAVRFEAKSDGEELWGLLVRNPNDL